MDSALGVTTYGNTVTLTAIVTNSVGNPVSEGGVSFYANGNLLATSPVNSSGIAGYTTKATAAGTVSLVAVYSDPSFNYSSSTSNTDTLTINPAPLTITASNQSMVYGGPFPTLTPALYSGFVNGDTIASLTTPGTLTTTATASSPVGNYINIESGASSPNYTITNVNGVFTITPDSTSTLIATVTVSGITPISTFSYGQAVRITAGVGSNFSSSSTETGSVAFYDGSTLLGTGVLGSVAVGGTQIITSSLSPGVHTLTAVYSGDANHTGSTSPSWTITGTPPLVITGTVFHDYNGNGIQDPGDPGIPGLTVFVDLDGSGIQKPADPTTTTDANGNYQLTVPSAGTYQVYVVVDGGTLETTTAGPVRLGGSGSNGQTSAISNAGEVFTSIAVPLTVPPKTPFPAQGSANADYVESLYRSILDRNADAGGLSNWTNLLNSGAATRLQVVQGIRNSPEHFTQEITAFYQTLLSRAPDPAGLQSWVQQLEGGMREEQIAFDFLNSPEFLGKGDKYFVDQMYIALLGRNFDSAGEASWLSQLSTGSQTHQQVITDFLYSTESLSRLTEGYYEVYLQRQADPGGLSGWVANLQQGTPFLTTGQLFLSSDEFYNRAAANG
jgi:hypothetical protein